MKHLLYILLLFITCLSVSAQTRGTSVEQRFEEASKLYNSGKFTQCQEISKALLWDATDEFKTNTYRLLALCYLAQDDITSARTYIDKMLKYDPTFSYQLNDPQRFKDLIDEAKNQAAGITTASKQEESIDEAPVPVTVITEDMIRHSGATTLQDVLALYVPGMTITEGVETNIAMHGIYSLMQDKILVMVDGHRLNSSSTNSEALDYRTSLDKVQQIEVLRGPASSLYGNVALTAVVNIITRKGAQVNGGRLTALVGTHSTFGGSFIVGGGNNVLDILGWGTMVYSKGISSTEDNGLSGAAAGTSTLYSNGFRGSPSFDIGIKGRWKDFTLSINLQRSKRVPYLNVLQMPATQTLASCFTGHTTNYDAFRNFNYDRYQSIGGDEAGVTRSNNRINLDYSHSLNDNIDISASGYISLENTSVYNVLGDSINNDFTSTILHGMEQASTASLMMGMLRQTTDDAGEQGRLFQGMIDQIMSNPTRIPHQGVFLKMDWRGITYGFQAQGTYNYNLGNLGAGSLIFGGQYEHFILSNSNFILGSNYSAAAAMYSSTIFREGDETSISGFMQLKHTIVKHLIFNAGLRYDHKIRFTSKKLDEFSPRFSLIYKLTDKFSLRGCYNYSFVDAPYLYRASIIKMFGGGSDMKPETMHSFNLGATYHDTKKRLTAEIGAFYNIINDLINIDLNIASVASYDYDPSTGKAKNVVLEFGHIFKNSGKVRNIGVDGSVQYTGKRFFGNFNATWQRILSSESYIVYNNQTYSTPAFHSNLTAAYAAYKGKGYDSRSKNFLHGGTLWVRGNVQFLTTTYYRTFDLMSSVLKGLEKSGAVTEKITSVDPQCNIGLGISYEWRYLDIDLTLKNLLNNTHKIGSMLTDGIPNNGRQFVAKATVKF